MGLSVVAGSMAGMTNWSAVERAAPELAAAVQGRFEAYGLAILATLRHDGSPRVSGIEPLFALGELWLGMMPRSRKSLDLQGDPRCALHSATTDKNVTDGDARISGRAVSVSNQADLDAFRGAFTAATGRQVPLLGDLYRVDVTELSMIRPTGDHLVIEFWKEGGEPQRIERR